MRINTNNYYINSYNQNFCGRIEKVIKLLQSTQNVKELKITTDEAIKIYEKFGYTVRKKAGSHMTVSHSNGIEFALKIPHGSEKRFIHSDAVKTLQCAVFENFKQLIQSLHYHKR